MGVNALIRKVLSEVGLRPERFGLQWASAAEAPRFVKLITEFTKEVQALGPLGQAEGLSPVEAKARIAKALELVSDRKVRMGLGNISKAIRKDGLFTQEQISVVVEEKLAKTITSGLGGSEAA